MTFNEFREIDKNYRQTKPKLFQLSFSDEAASDAQLKEVENRVGLKLPQDYRNFLAEFGGGDYGLTNIFSANPEGEFYLPLKREELVGYLPPDLLAFSDDGAGGFYVLKINEQQAEPSVFYWNQDGGLVETEFDSVLEYIVRYAYEPA